MYPNISRKFIETEGAEIELVSNGPPDVGGILVLAEFPSTIAPNETEVPTATPPSAAGSSTKLVELW